MPRPFWFCVVALVSCNQLGGDLPAPCDSLTLAQLQIECRQKVRASCARDADDKVDESCPVLIECSKRIHEWRDCSDAGAQAGAGQ